jgi:hypothetical protein
MRRLAPLALVPMALAGGCTCGTKTAPAGANGSTIASAAPSTPPAATAATGKLDASVFSAPIAAVHLAHQDVVAGLVAAEHVVRVLGLVDGKPAWSADAITSVNWAEDADVHLEAAGDAGALLSWRGPRAGASSHAIVLVGPHGEVSAAPVEVGSSSCATADGVAWVDPSRRGAIQIRARRWTEATDQQVLAVPPGRTPALVCGDHAFFVLGDGDDDLTVASFLLGATPQAPVVALRDDDFGDDEERDHFVYGAGDDIGFVRVASSGAVVVRELPKGGSLGAWRKLKHSIPADDDVAVVDGAADAIFIVYTHDAEDACPGVGSTAEAVRALRLDRKTGAETVLDLAPPDCERAPGPFWVAANAPGGPVIGWVERALKRDAKSAPIAGVALRSVTDAGMKAKRIELAADAVSVGGCTAGGCSVGALLRPTGADGMQPEAIAVFAYP